MQDKSAELKREVEQGSPFTLTSNLSSIASILFVNINILFYACTHIKITRHWKLTLRKLISNNDEDDKKQ